MFETLINSHSTPLGINPQWQELEYVFYFYVSIVIFDKFDGVTELKRGIMFKRLSGLILPAIIHKRTTYK